SDKRGHPRHFRWLAHCRRGDGTHLDYRGAQAVPGLFANRVTSDLFDLRGLRRPGKNDHAAERCQCAHGLGGHDVPSVAGETMMGKAMSAMRSLSSPLEGSAK